MKKAICFIISFTILTLLSISYASADGFTFRNGIKWGMTYDQVMAIEKENNFGLLDEDIQALADNAYMTYEQVKEVITEYIESEPTTTIKDGTIVYIPLAKISNYYAVLIYVFSDDSLQLCVYSQISTNAAYYKKGLDINNLYKTYAKVYGQEEKHPNIDLYKKLLSIVDSHNTDIDNTRLLYMWERDDKTRVFLDCGNIIQTDDRMPIILYVSPELQESISTTYTDEIDIFGV